MTGGADHNKASGVGTWDPRASGGKPPPDAWAPRVIGAWEVECGAAGGAGDGSEVARGS
jgi:hypothetical protein